MAGRAAASMLLAMCGALASCDACERIALPEPPRQCDENGKGCLPDEVCNAGVCELREKCESDDDCPSAAWECRSPAQVCQLRPGFGEECSADAPCDPGFFCALGKCRENATARPCAQHEDCPDGQACDREVFFCIEEAPCTLIDAYPEVGCDPDETCDPFSDRCRLQCQEECTVATQEQDCPVGGLCDAACRCVQCISDDDCGAGLLCNERAGRCESENLCFSDDDCEKPLICDPRTALCQVPPPPCDDDGDCAIAEICNRLTGICELPGGPCDDDRLEDADTPAAAEALDVPAAGDTLLVDDLQLCPDDDDVYALALTLGTSVTATLSRTTPAARATMWLLDAQGETSLAFAETPPRGSGSIAYVAQADETVYLRVNALVGPSPYDLTLTTAGGTPCAADPFEGANGNDVPSSPVPAANTPIGLELTASICRDDVDWYAVVLDQGEALDVTVAFDALSADFDLAVTDVAGAVILGQSASLQAPEHVRVRASQPMTVLVRVRGFGNSVGEYRMTLQRLPAETCTPDAFEPDEGVAEAPLLDIDDVVTAADRTLCVGEHDQYKVVLRDFERLVARAVYEPTDNDLVFEVYDETGTELRATSPFSLGSATMTYDARGDETVLVRLRGRLNGQGPYTLDVFRENIVTCTPDALEPNSIVASASAIPSPQTSLTICGSDEDYFSIDGDAGKTLHARIAFIDADGDLDLMVLGIDGSQVLAVSDGVADGEELNVTLPLEGVYTIRVFSLQGGATRARYTLDAALVDP